jgi:hypothetical protein
MIVITYFEKEMGVHVSRMFTRSFFIQYSGFIFLLFLSILSILENTTFLKLLLSQLSYKRVANTYPAGSIRMSELVTGPFIS